MTSPLPTSELASSVAGQSFAPAPCSAAGVMFSSASDEWATPPAFFEAQNFIYNFTLDVCASPANAKCARYFSAADDGLKQSWAGERCWMNPPYGRVIGDWMRKAYAESLRGALVVCLVPARTDTAWWHDCASKGEVTFLRGRLKFLAVGGNPLRKYPRIKGGLVPSNSAPFPSALVVMKPQNKLPSGEVEDVCAKCAIEEGESDEVIEALKECELALKHLLRNKKVGWIQQKAHEKAHAVLEKVKTKFR